MESGTQILLIDDDAQLREVVSILLEDEGFKVLQASNGQSALDLLKGLKNEDYPSCMILDLMMPVMSGSEFMETIHREHSQEFGNIPIIICSAEGKSGSFEQVVARLEKPVNIEVLCGAIKGCLH